MPLIRGFNLLVLLGVYHLDIERLVESISLLTLLRNSEKCDNSRAPGCQAEHHNYKNRTFFMVNMASNLERVKGHPTTKTMPHNMAAILQLHYGD